MSNTGWAVIIIALLVVLGGGFWWYSMQAPVAPAVTDTTVDASAPNGTGADAAQGGTGAGSGVDVGIGDNSAPVTTIHYTASGFAPAAVTVSSGQAVAFVNDTSGPMWVASDVHPTHANYDGTDRTTHCSGAYQGATPFDQCQPGSTYRYVFTKAGTFKFHNHSAAQFGGTVVVK